MRRVCVVCLVLTFAAGSSVVALDRAHFGLKGGLSIADQTYEYAYHLGIVDRDHRTGLAFGVFGDLDLAPSVTIRGEALYVQRGSQIEVPEYAYDSGGPVGTKVFKDRIDYLSLLATIKLQPPKAMFGPYLFAGPRLDIKAGDKSSFDTEEMAELFESYRSTIPGITIGLGFQRSVSRFATVMLEFRHDFNLADAAQLVTDENELTIKNKGSLFLLGIRF